MSVCHVSKSCAEHKAICLAAQAFVKPFLKSKRGSFKPDHASGRVIQVSPFDESIGPGYCSHMAAASLHIAAAKCRVS